MKQTISIETIFLALLLLASQIHEAQAIKRAAFIATANHHPRASVKVVDTASSNNVKTSNKNVHANKVNKNFAVKGQLLRYDSGGRLVSLLIFDVFLSCFALI